MCKISSIRWSTYTSDQSEKTLKYNMIIAGLMSVEKLQEDTQA